MPSSELRTSTPKAPIYGLFWHLHSLDVSNPTSEILSNLIETDSSLISGLPPVATGKHFHGSPNFAYSTYSINFSIIYQASTFFRASGFLDEFFRLVEVKGSPSQGPLTSTILVFLEFSSVCLWIKWGEYFTSRQSLTESSS